MDQYTHLIRLADGSYAAIIRSLSYGDAVLILLLTAILFLQGFELWSRRK